MCQVFISWSGGKDSCLAGYKALVSGQKISYLLNMATEDGRRSWTHGLSTELLQLQARAIRIPLIQKRTTMAGYETEFRDTVCGLKKEGVTDGFFGDVDIAIFGQRQRSINASSIVEDTVRCGIVCPCSSNNKFNQAATDIECANTIPA